MTRFVVSGLPDAEADIQEAYLWYRARSLFAADKFKKDILGAIDELAARASVWPRDEQGVHCRVMKRFPYTVHFEITDTVVTVLAVAHHRRIPNAWQNR